ncbi:MAG: secretion protein, partial [Barnesiella intestinihominis]
FGNKWFNVGVQDYLPTWRWWITDDSNNVPEDGIECGFTYEDAWYAGSALHMSGATKVSNVRLFKTKFDVSETDDVSMTFKLNSGEDTHMKLFWSFVGSESTLHSCDITGAKEGQWTTFSKKASEIGMNGNVALIGLKFENTPTNHVFIGEMAIVPRAHRSNGYHYRRKQNLEKRTYNSIDFKFSWDCESSKNDSDPPYPFITKM